MNDLLCKMVGSMDVTVLHGTIDVNKEFLIFIFKSDIYLYGLPVVCLHHMEIEAVHPSSRSKEDTAFLVKMIANVHQDLTKTDRLNRANLHTSILL